MNPSTPEIDPAVRADPALADLVEELTARLKAGEAVDLDGWLAERPEHASELRRLFPMLRLLAELSRSGDVSVPPALCEEALAGTLGDFRLIREVGRGGMGIVYEAEQITLGRRVALKVLPFAATMDPRHLQRFHNEARAAASLHHEHIVPVYAVGCERAVHFYAMQFIEGHSLAQLIAAQGPASGASAPHPAAATAPVAGAPTEAAPRDGAYFRRVAEWGVQAAEALEHAHSLGIVHRDVKPGNLLVDGRGKLWVTDFGLARTVSDAGLTMSGDLLGTLRYMSPEQALARHGLVDHRTDVYSLGATLYELLTGRPAVEGQDRQEILRRIADEEPSPPGRGVPTDLATIVLKALAREPAERYATAKELADDLRHWLEERPIKARRPSFRQVLSKWARRHRRGVTVAAAFTTLSGLLFIVGLLVHTSELRAASERERTQAEEATRQRDLAREQRGLARQAVDKMYTEVAEKWLADQPNMEGVRREFLEEALHFYEDFSRTAGSDPAARAETGKAYQRVAKIHFFLGRHRQAVENCSRAIATFRALADEFPDEPDYPYELASCHRMRAICHVSLREELEDGRKAVALLEPLVARFPTDPRFREALAVSLDNLSNPVSQVDPRETVALRRRAAALNEHILRDSGPRATFLRESAVIYMNLAEQLVWGGELGEAVDNYGKAITAFRALLPDPGNVQEYGRLRPYDWLNLGTAYCQLGEALGRLHRFDEAVEAARKGLKIHQKLAADFPRSVLYRPAVSNDACALGELYQRMGRPEEADQACQEALDACERMLKDFPTDWDLYHSVAHVLVSCPRPRFRDAPRAVRLAEAAVKAEPQNDYWNTLGVARYQTGAYQPALDALRESVRLRAGGNSFDGFYLAMAHWQLDDKPEASKWYQEAVRWMDRNRPQDADLLLLRAEAAALLGIKETPATTNEGVPPGKE